MPALMVLRMSLLPSSVFGNWEHHGGRNCDWLGEWRWFGCFWTAEERRDQLGTRMGGLGELSCTWIGGKSSNSNLSWVWKRGQWVTMQWNRTGGCMTAVPCTSWVYMIEGLLPNGKIGVDCGDALWNHSWTPHNSSTELTWSEQGPRRISCLRYNRFDELTQSTKRGGGITFLQQTG